MRKLLLLLVVLLLAAPTWSQRGALLETQKILVTGTPEPGRDVHVSVVVFNRGDNAAYGVSCTLSCNGVEWGMLTKAQELQPKQVMTLEGTLTVPAGGVGPLNADGTPKLVARLGQFYLPDLAIEKIELPDTLNQGEPTDVKITVVNKGRGPAGGPVLELLINGRPLETRRSLGRLSEGGRETVVISWTPQKEGKQELTAVVDRGRRVDEQDEGNNTQTAAVTVGAERAASLRINEMSLEQKEARVGTPVRLKLQLVNGGDQEVFRVPLVLQVNGREVLSKTYYVELPKQHTSEMLLRYTPTQAGAQNVTAILGSSGARPEAALRNSASLTVDVAPRAGYRLQVNALDVPARVAPNRDYIVTATVKNFGDMPAEVCKVSLVANGVRVASARSDRGLAPNEQARVKLHWTASKLGRVRLGALAEGSGAEAEDEKPFEVDVQVEEGAR